MKEEEIRSIKEKQRVFFERGNTLDIDFRIQSLKKLYKAIEEREEELEKALKLDLGKSKAEADMCEIRLTLSEITWQLKHIKKNAKRHKVRTPLSQFMATSYRYPSPYGNTLIMSPWNYPLLLTLEPLADAIAAGNTAIIKPSAYSYYTSEAIRALISAIFPEDYVAVVTGGREENKALLSLNFDYIFFTGSKAVGKEVMKSASAHLTPVTLELGGKSPVIVTESADIKLAARRIVFGKYLNAGQTCVAPDYILCSHRVKTEFIREVIKEIERQFSKDPLSNEDYGKIINEKHFDRLIKLINPNKVAAGGRYERSTLKIEPTVLDGVMLKDSVMKEEIFGPIMPILEYYTIEDAIKTIKSFEHPLALYIFSSKKSEIKRVEREIGFGGGCVNDTIIHLATSEMGFGGFRESGMGSYHGKAGFDTFSHYKSIVDKKTLIDLPMRYMPYTKFNQKLIRFFLK